MLQESVLLAAFVFVCSLNLVHSRRTFFVKINETFAKRFKTSETMIIHSRQLRRVANRLGLKIKIFLQPLTQTVVEAGSRRITKKHVS